jgi:hypothetical protein
MVEGVLMGEYKKTKLTIEEVAIMCSTNNLNNLIKSSETMEEKTKIIKDNAMKQDRTVHIATVKKYIDALQNSGLNDDQISFVDSDDNDKDEDESDNSKPENDPEGDNKSPEQNTTIEDKDNNLDQTKTSQNEDNENKGDHSSEDANSKSKTDNEPENKSGKEQDIVTEKTETSSDIVLIKNAQAEQYEELAKIKHEYESTIKTLTEKFNNLQGQIAKFMPKETQEEVPEKQDLNIQINTLNEIINSSNEKVTVEINRALLSKATKFVDAKSLVKLESIIREGYDLNSYIVQCLLLAFIHDNSLF